MFNDFPEDNQNDDFLNEFRQKLASQPTTKIEEKRKDMQRSKGVFLGAVAGVGLACAVGWFVLAPKFSPETNAELPVIKRPQTAVKIEPTEPGGMEIMNQDKTIYDIIDKTEEKTVENLLPPPEEPKLPEISAEKLAEEEAEKQAALAATQAQEAAKAPVETVVEKVAEEVTVVAEQATPKEVQNEGKEEETVSIAEASETLQQAQKRSALFVDPKIAYQESLKQRKAEEAAQFELAKAEAAKKAKEKATETKTETNNVLDSEFVELPVSLPTVAEPSVPTNQDTASVAPKGAWQIQLMSSKNKDAIEKSWTSMAKKYPFLASLPHEVEEAQIDSNAFYRLKTGAFTNKADADDVCNKIKAGGGSCLVKKK
ncbi:MAG: SPOR domain-containing protein [Alphaproteobacteria bacterium]|nr:SPOR domain-containing protein [Alphaproteobacteria bacterium]